MPATQEKVTLVLAVQNGEEAAKILKSFGLTAQKSMSQAERASTSSLGKIASQFVGTAVAIRSAQKVLSTGVGFNKFIEEQTMAFTVMMKSATAAKDKIAELYDFAVKSPLTFKETVSGSKQLLAYGFSAKELVPTMQTLGTVAKATGHSLQDISYVYGTLRAQGRAYTRDLMQFGMRGIPIYEELAAVLGVNQEELKKMTEEGKVGFKEVEQAFKNMTGEGGRFAGMMEKYMETLSGKLSMFKDIAEKSAGALAEGLNTALKSSIDGLMTALEGSQETLRVFGQELGQIVSSLLALLPVLIKLLPLIEVLVKTLILGKFLKLMTELPKLLMDSGKHILVVARGVKSLNASLVGGGMIAGLTRLSTALKILNGNLLVLATNPAFIALAGIAGGIAAISMMQKAYAADAALKETNPTEAVRQAILADLQRAFSMDATGMGNILYTGADIKKFATNFGVEVDVVTGIMQRLGVVTDEVIEAIAADAKAAKEAAERRSEMKSIRTTSFIPKWASTAEALGVDYTKLSKSGKGAGSVPIPIATDFMNEFVKTLASFDMRDALQKAGVSKELVAEETQSVLKAQFEQVNAALQAVITRDFLNPDDTNPVLKARLAELLNTIAAQLGEGSDKVKRDLWYTRELQAKATKDQQDDLLLAYDKERATALEKYKSGEIDYEDYWNALIAIADIYGNDMIELYASQWDEILSGSSEYFTQLKADAKQAYDAGNVKEGVIAQLLGGLEGTEVGAVLSNLMMGVNPLIAIVVQVVEAFMSLFMSIENVQAILNPFNTIMEAAFAIIGPIINQGLSGLVSVLQEVGAVLGEVLAPVFSIIGYYLQMMAGVLKITLIPVLQLVGEVFRWLNDKVIVPIGNKMVDIINSVINWMNDTLGTSITPLQRFLTVAEAAADSAGTATDSLAATINYLQQKLDSMIDAQIQSAQDLYEVGAITASEYEGLVEEANKFRIDRDLELVSLADQQLTTMQSIYDRLGALYDEQDAANNATSGTTATGAALAASNAGSTSIIGTITQGVSNAISTVGGWIGSAWGGLGDWTGWWDVGTPEITRDHVAMVHKGETIVPKTFAEGLRSGDLTLGNADSMRGGGDVYVTVQVSGSVTTENDLATSIANKIYVQRQRGLITV